VEDDGRRAVFLLLETLGLAPEAWRELPGHLPTGPHLVWIARAPKLDEDTVDEDDPLLRARADGAGGLRRYAEFARQGGTVLLPATKRGVAFARHFALPAELELPAPWKLAEALVLSGGGLEEAPGVAGVELRDAEGRIAAVALPVEAGTIAAGGRPGPHFRRQPPAHRGKRLFLRTGRPAFPGHQPACDD
jgi:hypothetical protein